MKKVFAVSLLALGSICSAEVSMPTESSSLEGFTFVNQPTVQPKQKVESFFDSNVNKMLAVSALTTWTLDSVSTRQGLTNSCKCFEEGNSFFGASLKPVANSSWKMYSYSAANAFGAIAVSQSLWNHASHSKHSKLFHSMSRIVLAVDVSMDAYTGPINNWSKINSIR